MNYYTNSAYKPPATAAPVCSQEFGRRMRPNRPAPLQCRVEGLEFNHVQAAQPRACADCEGTLDSLQALVVREVDLATVQPGEYSRCCCSSRGASSYR
jgi:hypothetical protein